jgi:glucan biosynthesis protein C
MRKSARRYDIDWLRVLAVLALIPFHAARIFDIWEPFYAKSDRVSAALTHIFIGGINSWHMPLFFLLAGASTWFALQFRSGGQYMRERFKRLIVPLLFGTLVIVAPQTYLGARTYGEFAGSFFQYYPRFFQIGATGDLSGYMGGFTPGHLWFILFLFLISLIVLPLLLYLKRENGRRLLGKLAALFSRPGMIFLWAIPLILMLPLPDIGGKDFFYYLILFVYGYVLVADARFEEALDRHKVPALVLGLGLLMSVIGIMASGLQVVGVVESFLEVCYKGIATWLLLIAFLGFGRKYLNFTNKVLKYASESAYPFYILHQTVIVLVGYYVVQWDISVWPQFLIISVASVLAILLAYGVLVRRTGVTRFLFGMKARRQEKKRGLPHAVRQET